MMGDVVTSQSARPTGASTALSRLILATPRGLSELNRMARIGRTIWPRKTAAEIVRMVGRRSET